MIWAKAFKQLICLALLIVLSSTPCLAEQPDNDVKTPSAVTVDYGKESAVVQAEEKKPRLKFRRGPVCMCNDGLSEAEIQAAWTKRYSQSKD